MRHKDNCSNPIAIDPCSITSHFVQIIIWRLLKTLGVGWHQMAWFSKNGVTFIYVRTSHVRRRCDDALGATPWYGGDCCSSTLRTYSHYFPSTVNIKWLLPTISGHSVRSVEERFICRFLKAGSAAKLRLRIRFYTSYEITVWAVSWERIFLRREFVPLPTVHFILFSCAFYTTSFSSPSIYIPQLRNCRH